MNGVQNTPKKELKSSVVHEPEIKKSARLSIWQMGAFVVTLRDDNIL